MLLTITLIISSLVIINLLLLKFSSNKINRTEKQNEKPVVLKPEIPVKTLPKVLAATGS
ncbi:hypothetical protein VOI54_13060 [Tamlana sp. 2201CG12-4]|uniref:hypothetical protein n=1 Tax=Tamlana sp. 2201CG12-4 TaxID=3112582 RepID=UPI002DBA5E1C|nr:hypothetical protein [Tamlana sp. 2201CG12-4]MEC3907953.1 hypothetical protein [Tamlana sp. 2201CG12-4]